MAKQLNIDMSVHADTSQAKKALIDLQKSLQDIQNIKNMPMIADESYKSAAAAAKELEKNLSAATNVKTGKLDLNKFSMSLKSSNTSISELAIKLSGAGATGQQAFLNLAKSIALADNSALNLGNKISGLMTTLKNTAKWQISSSLLHGFMGAIQSAYGYAQDLNESLNNIRIITGQNIDQMAQFAKEANNAARALSTTTTEYTNASLIYYQQGLSDEDVKARTDATIKMANVTRQSAEEVSSQMTAIWNNFADGAENLEYYEDVVTKLGASTASSSKEILDGLSKFAAVSETVDLSYEKASAALATVVAETRQSADTVGNAFKTLFARVEGLKLGETLEDGVDLNKYSKALDAVGVKILDANKQVKSMDDILDELGVKWDNIGKSEQIALAQTVAGVRQYTQFIALMDNYDKVQKNEDIARSSAGTIQEQADIYAEGWEAARDRVTAAAEEIYDQLLNDEAFIDILNGFEKFLGFISDVIDGLGGIQGVLLLIGSIFMQQYAKEMPRFLQTISQNLMIITGQGEKVKQNMLAEIEASLAVERSSMASFNQTNGSYEMQAKYEATQKAVKMTQELNASIKTLSETEKEEAKTKINQVIQEGEYIALLGKEIDAQNQKIKTSTAQASKSATASFQGISNKTKKELEKMGTFDFEDQSFSEAITSAIRNRDNLRKSQEELKKRNKSLGAQEGALTKKAEEIEDEEKLKTIIQQRKQLEDEIQKNREQIKVQRKLEIEEETVIKGLKESQKAGQNFINGQFKDTVMNARVLSKESDNIVQRTQKWKAAQAQINDAQEKGRLTFQKSKQLTAELGNEMKKYGNYIQDTAEKMLKTENITDAEKDTFNNLIASAKEFNNAIDSGDLEDAFKLLDQSGGNFFYSLSEAAGTADLKVEELTKKILGMGYTNDDVEKLIPLFQELADKTQPFNTGLDALRQKLLDLQNKTIPLSQAFSQMGSSLMQISMAINAIKNIGDIWNNEDLDTGEKVLQTMTAMGTLIPTLIGLYTTFNTLKKANIFLQIREAVVTKAKAAADFIATLAQEGLNKAMRDNPAGAIITLIMLLVSALAFLIIEINKAAHAETEQQKALEKSNRELEEAKKVADEAKQAYEDLYNKVSDYKTAEEALKKCTKGTQEWKDAFQEVLNKANELIKIYPQLLDYENLFDNDGTINTEILDQAVEDFQKRSVSGQVLVAEKAKENSVRQFENNKAELSDEIVPGRDNFSNGIVDLLLSKRGDINFSDSTQIGKIVEDFLSEQGETTSQALDINTTHFTEKIVELGDKFTELGNEADSVATSLANAEKIINQDFFGDKVDFSASGKNLAYTEARSQAKQEEEEKMQNLEDSLDAKSFAKTVAEEYVKYDNEASSKHWKYKETKTNKNGDSVLVYIDENNEEQEKILNVVKDAIIENRLVNNKDNIAQQGEKKYENEYKNMDAAVLSYLENGNFGAATGEDLVKTSSEALKKYFDEKFKDDDENNTKKKQYIADLKYGGDISQVTDSIYEAFFNDWEQGLKKVQTGIQEIPNYITEASHGLINKVSSDSISKVQDMYNKALAKGGQESADLITNILEGAGDKAGQVAEQLVNMDLSSMDTDQINTELSNLGLNFQLTAGQVAALKDVVCDSIFATEEAAQKSYETVNKIVSKIKAVGDTITDEEYKQLLKINPAMEIFFTTLADGTHMLTGEVLDFKTAMQSASLAKFYQVIEQNKKDIEAYGTLSQGYTSYDQLIKENSTYKKSTLYSYNAKDGTLVPGDSAMTIKSTDTSNFWKDYEDQTRAMIQALFDNGEEEKATDFLAKINAAEAKEEIGKLNEIVPEVAKAFDKAGISTENFAEKTAKAKEEIEETTAKMKEAQYQFEISNTGLNYEETENYANVLMEIHEAEGLTKEAARELAIANQRLDRGLSSLNDNFETWTKSLKNTSKDSAEYAKTISELRKSFADLLNIADANELSLDWIEKWVNDAEEMAKILDGDAEAIQRFRESAFTEMTTNVFTDMRDSAQEMLDKIKESNKEIPEYLQNVISSLGNGISFAQGLQEAIHNLGNAEIGSGAVLSDEYVQALNQMLQAGLLTEQQLNDIFASIGYKPKVTTKYIQQMVDVPIYETEETVLEDEPPQYDYVYGTTPDGRQDLNNAVAIMVKPGKLRKRSITSQVDHTSMLQSVPVAQIESADKATGNIEIVNAGSTKITPSYSSTTSGKNSDSGSKSSSSTPTTKAASHNHEVNRYSNEENALKGLSNQYKRLNDAKDKAFGQGRIKMIEQEISKLRDLKKASSDYLDTIVGSGNSDKVMKALYYGEDIGKLITSGQLGGTIGADYRSLYNGADASGKNLEYTAKDSNGNEWLVSDNYSLAGFNSLFGSNLSFTFDSFGNIVGQDAIKNFLQELRNQEEDSYSSVADPDANSTTLHNKRLAYLEAIENRLDQFNDTAEKLSDQVDSRLEYISQLQEKNAELISAKLEYGNQIDESLTKTLDRSLKVLGDRIYKTPEAMNKYFANQQKRIEMANNSIARYRENLAEIEYRNSLYNQPGGQFNPEALSDSKAAELYSEIEDKIDAEIDIIQEAEEALSDYYSNLLDSLNKDISNITKKIEFNAKILEHYQRVAELTGRETDYEFLGTIIQRQIDVSEQAFLANQKLADEAEQSYNYWQQKYDEAIANNEPVEVLEDITKHMEEAYDEMQTRQEQAMESYVNYLEKANAKFQNDVNKIFADFEKKNSGIYGNFELMDKAIERQKSLSEDYLTKTNQIYETNSLLRKLNQDINKTDSVTAKQKLKAFSDEITSMKEQEKLSKTDLEIAKARYEVLQAEIALRDAQNAKSVVRLQRDSEGNYGYVYTADQDRIAEAEQTVEDKQNALYNLVLNYANDYSEKLFQLEREHEEALKELANNTALSEEERNAERARINEYFLNKRQALLDTHNKAMVYLDQLAAEGRAEAWSESFSQTIKDQDEYKIEFDNLMDDLEDKMKENNELRSRHAQEARVDNKSVEQSIDNITKSTQRLGDQITKKGGLADQYSILREKADNLTSTTSKMRDEFNKSISVLQNLANKAGELYRNLDNAAEAQRDYNKAVAEAPSGSGTTTYGSNSGSGDNGGGGSSSSGSGTSGSSTPKTCPPHDYYLIRTYWRNVGSPYALYPGGPLTQYETQKVFIYECDICHKTRMVYGPIGMSLSDISDRTYLDNYDSLSYTDIKTGFHFKSGGYTGTWNGPDLEENGKLAFLHQKELVLNADDTENVLSAVKMIRQISQTIDLQAAAQSSSFQAVAARITGNDQTLQQEVTIHAEFPNVNDHNEIEEAFNNLINRASQYVNRY